jgi:hypothetical protein
MIKLVISSSIGANKIDPFKIGAIAFQRNLPSSVLDIIRRILWQRPSITIVVIILYKYFSVINFKYSKRPRTLQNKFSLFLNSFGHHSTDFVATTIYYNKSFFYNLYFTVINFKCFKTF